MKQKFKRNHTLIMVQMAVLIAIMLVLELTGIGMIRIGTLEMTILQFPVIVGAILMGPAAGAGLGLVFGLISFWECFGKSSFGTTLLSIQPFYTFLTCVPTRVLMGFLCGLIFKGLYKAFGGIHKNNPVVKTIPYVIASLSGALLNTVFFMGVLVLSFGNTEFIQGFVGMSGVNNMFLFVCWFVGVQGLVEALLCAFLGSVVSRAVDAILRK